MNATTTACPNNETSVVGYSQAEPALNLRDPLLFPLDEAENPEIGVRPPKASIAAALLRPRDRRTAGPAGWGNLRELTAALDAHAKRVGWKSQYNKFRKGTPQQDHHVPPFTAAVAIDRAA